ncbi:MAG: DNA-binding domain-containing protein [Xenococcaceae cyanobacterium]
MTRPQLTVRMPPDLCEKLNNYVKRTGTSKIEVVVGAISNYLGCAEDIPLSQRMASVERRLAELEAQMRAKNN